MYICEFCNTQVGPGISCNIVVVETREKVYPARPKENDPGGVGIEIAREARICAECNTTGE